LVDYESKGSALSNSSCGGVKGFGAFIIIWGEKKMWYGGEG
jgi:hypothetical protein